MNNKTQKLLSLVIGFILLGSALPLWAQIDEARLQRDLEVAEAVLNEMFDASERNGSSALYLDGYGVIITLPSSKQNSFVLGNVVPNFRIQEIVMPNVERIIEGEMKLLDKQMQILDEQLNEVEVEIENSNMSNKDKKRQREKLEKRRVEIEAKRNKMEIAREKIEGKRERQERERERLEERIEREAERLEERMEREAEALEERIEIEMEREDNNDNSFSYVINGQGNVLAENFTTTDSTAQAKKLEEVKANMHKFLQNYADLIGQLKPTDKILLVYGYSKPQNLLMNDANGKTVISWVGQNNISTSQNQLLMTAQKQDIAAFRSGSINKENFKQKVQVQEVSTEVEEGGDLEILASILEKLIKKEYKEQNPLFAKANKVAYTHLPDFGVIYRLKIQPLTRIHFRTKGQMTPRIVQRNNGQVYIYEYSDEEKFPVAPKPPKSPQKPKTQIEDDCQELVDNIKEYMVQYGRTLRSLSSEEQLIIELDLGNRYLGDKECAEKIYLSIAKKVLNDYDQAKISFEQTLKKIKQVNR